MRELNSWMWIRLSLKNNSCIMHSWTDSLKKERHRWIANLRTTLSKLFIKIQTVSINSLCTIYRLGITISSWSSMQNKTISTKRSQFRININFQMTWNISYFYLENCLLFSLLMVQLTKKSHMQFTVDRNKKKHLDKTSLEPSTHFFLTSK